ncbi:hypothetical protein MGALJ_37720 [Mycobacterium gallinarum]|uniref:Uncharacterized protein n=1 Tax=Mycobacterium gallinarum TaxID=39689 RepID=A0A9W4FGT3_9MYCO|nr:hypothetical protein [Mycobacterium gallinarum]BBY94103.1 hypothetical protein MGALJ_37720 [Mycobacterium gallinarum]
MGPREFAPTTALADLIEAAETMDGSPAPCSAIAPPPTDTAPRRIPRFRNARRLLDEGLPFSARSLVSR